MNQSATKKSANKQKTTAIKASDLPLSCPPLDVSAWNSHPRIFLEFNAQGEASCQYCGSHYKLDDQN